MNVVAICIHDREDNLTHWLNCWKQCNQNAQLVIIHSDSGKTYEVPEGVIYLKRPNIGYDIAKFQDVCLNRMPGFPEWEKLLWMCDDCFPMSIDFFTPYFEKLNDPQIGVVCTDLSPYKKLHIRTTGFAIRREVAQKLTFPADPVTSKDHCYDFEHRSRNAFYEQIKRMGLKVIQVSPRETSPLFDMGYTRRIKSRELEHYNLFGRKETVLPNFSRQKAVMPVKIEEKKPKVIFVCPIYDKYPQIISSLICQTYKDWQLNLIHDGPQDIEVPDDPRINYIRVERKTNDYGHTLRAEWLQKVNSDYIVITNPDNYYAPVFIEKAIKAFEKRPNSIAVFCSQMVHSYTDWRVISVKVRRGHIDCGGVMLKTKEAAEVGWNSRDHSADWFFFNDIANRYGLDKFTPFEGALFVHN